MRLVDRPTESESLTLASLARRVDALAQRIVVLERSLDELTARVVAGEIETAELVETGG